ncbi:hypothetical protein ACLB2K_029441 [Fragaria x ananassa]
MTPENANKNFMKMKAFLFSMADKAKIWLYRLSKILALRKQITGIEQGLDESYPEYFERFQTLVIECPPHGSEESLLTTFMMASI